MKQGERIWLEKLIAALGAGLLRALRVGAITLEDAEHLLFCPGVMDELSRCGASQRIVDLVHKGTELEDILDLTPDAYSLSIEQLESECIDALRGSEKSDFNQERWLKAF